MQRDFQFKLPAKRAAPAMTGGNADASTSTDTSLTKRKPGRPRGSGPKQKAAAAAAAAAAASEASFDAGSSLNAYSPPPEYDGGVPYSPHTDASGSMGVGRRVAKPRTSGPISSTPAPSRIRKQGQSHLSSSNIDPMLRGDHDDELGSQLGEDYSGSSAASAGGSGDSGANMDMSTGWDAGGMDLGGDESLPMIPSPAASSSHVDTSIRRMRPSIGGTSVSRLSIASDPNSPAARAAQRNLDQRQRRRQASPGKERVYKQAAATAAAARQQARPPRRALVQIPSELDDETLMDRTVLERQRGNAAALASARAARPERDMQKRLKRALSLVFSASEDPDDPDSSRSTKKRKSAKYLNDVDIIWSIVDEELRSAIEEQPAKAPFLALKALRKSVRSNFLNLSEKTDNRTTLISQLMRARKQKRMLRKEVFAKRSELAKVNVEAKERQKEMDDWKNEVGEVRRANNFLLNLRHQAAAWT